MIAISPLPALAALLALTGCTTPIVRDTSAIDPITAKCESVDCVIAAMDTLPQGDDRDRYPWMEGVPDAKLAKMKAAGKLDIAPLNPLWLATLTMGYAYMEAKPLGGMDSCQVRYLPGGNWWSLKHELAHCQGYADHGIPLEVGTYTPDQQSIMDKEGATRWVDTAAHKSGVAR